MNARVSAGSASTTFASGLALFAGVMMVVSGVFQFFEGIVAVADDSFFLSTENYTFEIDVTAWGWIHLIAGVIVAFAGAALFRGSVWARTVAVVLACVSILANFLWLPYYPFWSITVIALNVFVIWAVTVHGRDIAQP